MKKKILITLTVLVLIILPFLMAVAISKYSPYVEANSFQRYVIICTVISIAIVSVVLLLFKRFQQSLEKTSVGGILLFLLLCPLVGIYGLASAPALSLRMLEHPEREHFRYSLLFIALILFGGFILFLFRSNSLTIKINQMDNDRDSSLSLRRIYLGVHSSLLISRRIEGLGKPR